MNYTIKNSSRKWTLFHFLFVVICAIIAYFILSVPLSFFFPESVKTVFPKSFPQGQLWFKAFNVTYWKFDSLYEMTIKLDKLSYYDNYLLVYPQKILKICISSYCNNTEETLDNISFVERKIKSDLPLCEENKKFKFKVTIKYEAREYITAKSIYGRTIASNTPLFSTREDSGVIWGNCNIGSEVKLT
jgi:hypothetical protein